LKPYTPEKTRVFWDAVMRNAHVSTIEELKKVEPKTLFYAWDQACKDSKFSIPYTLPVYDGKLLTKNTFGKKDIPDTPCMIGVTTLDMMPIGLKVLTCKWAKISNRHNGHRCYTYLFARDLPGDDRGAWHSSDLLYFFSSYKRNWRPFEEVDYEISKQMSGALCAFARKQNPDCDEIPAWGSGAKRPMVFCEHTGVAKWGNKKLFHNTFQKNVMTEK
ncbi:MAG: carboxylesterase family protein, partial [Lachnospira sp.]|nr:carboxylesterase family protein [Lachnospira sp.]